MSQSIAGVGLKVISGLLFVVLATLVKLLAARYPLGQIIFFRCIAALPVLICVAALFGTLSRDLRPSRPWLHVGRSLVGLASMVFNFLAYVYLPLAEAQAISFLTPLALLVFTMLGFGERGTWWTWAAVVLGLAGVCLMLDTVPLLTLTTTDHLGALFGILGAVFAAIAMLLIRALSRTDSTGSIALSFTGVGALAGMATAPFGWVRPDIADVPLLVALGVVGALAHFALVAALARAPAAKLSPYDYLTIVWAVALGAILFRHWPAPHEIAGMAMIIATGFVGSLGTKAARPIASGK